MEVKHRIIIKRVDGVPVNVRYEPVKSLAEAARFKDIEEYQRFITGFYKPSDASIFKPQMIRITYEEMEDEPDVQ